MNTVANHQAKNIIDTLYKVTFEATEIGTPFAVPFIASFCGHGEDEAYVQENGLLSQWRSYGEGGGFAIVFDTKKLYELLENESQNYFYSIGAFADVVYDGDDEEFREEFTELVEMLQDMVGEMMRGREPQVDGLFGPFVNSVSRFKHRGFKEEREVRIVTSPMSKETIEEIKRSEAAEELADRRVKEIKYKDRNGVNVPYIELFESVEKDSLPITKIIIGPGREQQASETKLRTIIGRRDVEIHCSETPYVPSK